MQKQRVMPLVDALINRHNTDQSEPAQRNTNVQIYAVIKCSINSFVTFVVMNIEPKVKTVMPCPTIELL